jgi:hypothetical protein
MPSTLTKYIGKTLLEIRKKFPQHPDFEGLKNNSDVPKWWSNMHPTFEKQCTRFHYKLGSDYTFGETSTRTLYQDNGYSHIDREVINDYVSLIDLNMILRKLMKDAVLNSNQSGKLQQRCWLAILYQAIGRGGEIKRQDLTEWMYHPKFETVDIQWTESPWELGYDATRRSWQP